MNLTIEPICFNDIPNLCRVCLKKADLINIFESSFENLHTIFEAVFKETLMLHDEKPKNLCIQCITSLIAFYNFITMYENSKSIIENILIPNDLHLKCKFTSDDNDNDIELINDCSEDHINFESDLFSNVAEIELSEDQFALDTLDGVKRDIFEDAESILMNEELLRDAESKEEIETVEKPKISKKRTKCETCGKEMLTRSYKRHSTLHCLYKLTKVKETSEKPSEGHVCHICDKKYTQPWNLKQHIQTVHEGKWFRCEKCPNRTFNRKDKLRKHIEKFHKSIANKQGFLSVEKKSKYVVCDICGRQTPRNSHRRLILHDMYHKFGHKFMCKVPDCNLTFLDSPSRLVHMTSDHKTFTCQECYKDFQNEERFKAHCNIHVWESKENLYEPLTCRICDESSFSSNEILAEHLLNAHSIYWCLITDNCKQMFLTKAAFTFHRMQHKKKTEWTQFSCEICQKKFNSESLFQVHQKVHFKTNGVKCTTCGYILENNNKLTEHMRLHTGEKPFQCSFCKKRFRRDSSRILHERIHTGEKRFKCKNCEKAFTFSTDLCKHIRKFHNKPKNEENRPIVDTTTN